MVKAFKAPGEPVPTWRTIGEVYELEEEHFAGVIEDEEGNRVVIEIPFENIVESERPRVARGIMFFCDLAVVPAGQVGGIRGIEFSDELTDRENDRIFGVFSQTLANAEARKLPDNDQIPKET